MAIPWTITPVGGTPFLLDEPGGSDTGRFSRGDLIGAYNIPARQISSSVVAHNPGERRTNSRDVAKQIKFTGFCWGNPGKTEPDFRANWDTLQQAFGGGIQQLCLDGDGRYWLAELVQLDDGLKDGDVWHTEYTATFYSAEAYSYASAPVTAAVLTNTALTAVSGTQYSYAWTAGPADQLGSAPSPLLVTVTLNVANGCFYLALVNNSTSPATTCAAIAPPGLGPFINGDVVTFDGVNGQVTLTRAGVTTKSPLPVVPVVLDSFVAAPTSLSLLARATSAPVVSIGSSFQGRYR